MTTDELLGVLESRSLEVAVRADGTLALRGDTRYATPALLAVLRLPVHRQEILRRLAPAVRSVVVVETPAGPEPCPRCGRPLDGKSRCWAKKCGWRRCGDCGKDTGNVFIGLCLLCEHRWRQGHGQGQPDTEAG